MTVYPSSRPNMDTIPTPEHLLRECTEHLVLAHSAICRQAQARASVRMHSVQANVMPYHIITLQNKNKSFFHPYMNYSGEQFVSFSFSAQCTL